MTADPQGTRLRRRAADRKPVQMPGDDPERRRLAEDAAKVQSAALGTVSERATMGYGARGLQPTR
jgi:hypothetical protein